MLQAKRPATVSGPASRWSWLEGLGDKLVNVVNIWMPDPSSEYDWCHESDVSADVISAISTGTLYQ